MSQVGTTEVLEQQPARTDREIYTPQERDSVNRAAELSDIVSGALLDERLVQLLVVNITTGEYLLRYQETGGALVEIHVDPYTYAVLAEVMSNRALPLGESELTPKRNAQEMLRFEFSEGPPYETYFIVTLHGLTSVPYIFNFESHTQKDRAYQLIRLMLCGNSQTEPVTISKIFDVILSAGGTFQTGQVA